MRPTLGVRGAAGLPPALGRFGTATAGGGASTAGWTRAAGLGGTMGSEAADEACVTAPVATEPDGAMWAFSAMRPATIRPPITTKYFRISITSPWARKDRRTPLVAAAAGLVHFRSSRALGALPSAWEGDGGGGMVSNHRLVLFTHALCRLSYPAVGPIVTRPGLAGLFKIAHPRARHSLPAPTEMRRPNRPRPDG